MKRGLFFISLIILCISVAYAQSKPTVYLIPGQGSDYRIFNNIQIDENFDTVFIHYMAPKPYETMHEYALRLSTQIDTTLTFYILGVSLGGMLSCELADILHPEKVIIISSASNKSEIPTMYRFFRNFPVHEYIPANVFKYATFIMQPLYEHDRKLERSTCNAMIWEKDPVFIKRATEMIVNWNRTAEQNENLNIVHIHGDDDHTLPLANVKADYIIENGSHMMTLTKGKAISAIINSELLKN